MGTLTTKTFTRWMEKDQAAKLFESVTPHDQDLVFLQRLPDHKYLGRGYPHAYKVKITLTHNDGMNFVSRFMFKLNKALVAFGKAFNG